MGSVPCHLVADRSVHVETPEDALESLAGVVEQETPEAALLRIQRELGQRNFVWIPGSTYRKMLKWKGAREEDLLALEAGKMHAEVPRDPEPNMYFRQVAFHRLVLSGGREGHAPLEAQMPGVTQIGAEEICSDTGAKVSFARSKTRTWPMPPSAYAASTVPLAIAALNEALLPEAHHPQGNINMDSPNVINDQILIRINKQGESDESPTPEGVHQDGTEVSSVTLIGRRGVTRGGESRIWKLDQPAGNYSSDQFGSMKKRLSIKTPIHFSWENCLFDKALTEPWESVFFNDRLVKHEARGFDGVRPCQRDVIVNFLRKPLLDGSDNMKVGGRIVPIV